MKFRTKLLVFNLLVIAILTVLSIAFAYDFRKLANLPAQGKAIESRAKATLRQLSQTCEVALATKNAHDIKRIVASHASDEDLAFLEVADDKGKTLGSLGERGAVRTLKKRAPRKLHRAGVMASIWAPVQIEGVKLGSISVGFSLERIEMAQRRVFLFTVLVLAAALLSFIASLFFAGKLTSPVIQMTHAFRRMAEGDLAQRAISTTAADETGELSSAFNELLSTLRDLGGTAEEVARGNLSVSVTAKGDLGVAFSQMVEGQRALVKQIADTAILLTSAASEFRASAQQQQEGAIKQASAVEENRRTMDSLLASARTVAETAQGVLSTAERTQNNSRLVAERIEALTAHTQRIAEILVVIKEIANKSDLLALNAALEGTKAGEAGRGFSLVAKQMKRLAENVMASVRDISELTDTIGQATRATVVATDESNKLAADTTRSARQIAMIVQQQQTGTEQVTRAMNDVAAIARETTVGGKEIVASSKELVQLAEQLRENVGRFSTEDTSEPNEHV